jgi:methylmalonyl-CoA/ethylmalonyl-CoA epimerase
MAGYKKIDHVGVAVRDLDKAIAHWRDAMGFVYEGRERVESEGTEVAFFHIGESRIELLAPLGDDTPIGKFIAKRGEGVHHLCFAVDGIERQLVALDGAQVPLIDKTPKAGAHNCRVAFVHPKGSNGVLIELSEPGATSAHTPSQGAAE